MVRPVHQQSYQGTPPVSGRRAGKGDVTFNSGVLYITQNSPVTGQLGFDCGLNNEDAKKRKLGR